MERTGEGSSSPEVAAGRTDLGRRVAARREQLGLTREQLGERCGGVSASYVTYLEEQAAAPAIGSLLRVADALGTTVAELTGATADYPPGRGTALHNADLVELADEACRLLLSTHGIGRIAVLASEEGPAIVPVNYSVAGEEIVFRTSGGSIIANAAGEEAAFEVDHIDEVARQGWSVLVVGRLEGVTDSAERERLDALAHSLPWAGGARSHWMVLVPTRITGRRVTIR
ncbi:helix-turn-helix domain-containing protein [Streptomyces sp. NPDC051546]|uniref:helix-turn-helix domain-containing protein n=1 Tax=Streptomyces sp. NPDC051546 TaxID=3365655 RepID=UPI0037AC78D6